MSKTRVLMKFRFMEHKHSLDGAPNFRIYPFPDLQLGAPLD